MRGPEDVWAVGACGLLGRARLEGESAEVALADCRAKAGSPGRQLLADDGYWFGNFGECCPPGSPPRPRPEP